MNDAQREYFRKREHKAYSIYCEALDGPEKDKYEIEWNVWFSICMDFNITPIKYEGVLN